MNLWDGMMTPMNSCNKDFMLFEYSTGVCGWSIRWARTMGTAGFF